MLFRNFHNLNRLFKDLELSQSETDDGEWERKTYVSDTGLFSYSYVTRKPKQMDEVSSLKKELDKRVEEQDFEGAVEIRDKIKSLEKNKEKISDLKKQLDESIKLQDFERSIELRDKINSLK
jgi:protein-arginine kinase activator protein McsA